MKKELVNDRAAAYGISFTRFGYERCESTAGDTVEPDGNIKMFGVAEGAGSLEAAGKKYSVRKGDLIVVRGGIRVSYSSDAASPATFFHVFLTGADAEYYLSELGCSGEVCRVRSDSGELFSAVVKCTDLCLGDKSVFQSTITSILLGGISSVRSSRAPRVRMRAAEQAERAEIFIENNYMNGITARDVSVELNIDRTHFFRIFKARTGLSPEQYIMRLRIKRAKELLMTSSYTVTEIASLVGVGDVYYFSKLFKKFEGVSPTEYRRETGGGAL